MRNIVHPGEAVEPRVLALPCTVRSLRLTFKPGMPVLDAVTEAFAPLGIESAVVTISGGTFDPLIYVMPAPASDAIHAAWYSETHSPEGRGAIETLTFTYGRRDGAPFLHCHGIWHHADASRHAGHLMPHDARFAEAVDAEVLAVSGAVLDQLDDDETKFKLFTPVPLEGPEAEGGKRGVLCRVKPNAEINAAVEQTARAAGFERATLHGIGSLVGCDFVDGQHMESFASELFIRKGTVETINGEHVSSIDIGIVDVDGAIFEGEIVRGRNPVCVTFELLIVED
ncbi:DUF296 domain-containing protein [Corticibacterium sp. UT-5YL-CI-8]|nr:DUF296 domain-containing protein [Tianweitania sp. UT-5YL-CI-8]